MELLDAAHAGIIRALQQCIFDQQGIVNYLAGLPGSQKNQASLEHVKDFHHWQKMPDGFFDVGFFANVVPHPKGGYIGACRVGNATSADKIDIVHYDDDLVLTYRDEATEGEDPRCFIYKNLPYALTWSPRLQAGISVVNYKIISLLDNNVTLLSVNGSVECTWPTLGKNWMPLEKDGELYLVVALEPKLHILHCNLENGECTWLPGLKPDGAVEVTISRGGTPFIYSKKLDCYVGLGHRTYSTSHHTPFLYTLTKELDKVIIGEDIPTEKTDVQDPQSIFIKNEKLYCCIGNWHVPNDGCVGMYEILLKGGHSQ